MHVQVFTHSDFEGRVPRNKGNSVLQERGMKQESPRASQGEKFSIHGPSFSQDL